METDLLMQTSGRIVAIEFAIKVLMETHPDPAELRSVWNEHSADLIDAGMENPLYSQVPAYRDGLNSQLARLARFLPGR